MFFLIILIWLNQIGEFSDKIEVKDSWIRPGAKGMNTALYFEIVNRNNEADTLYKAESDFANVVELHETYQNGEMMGMRKTEFVIVKGNSSFSFKPKGNHIMLIDLKEKLKIGDKKEVILFFKNAGSIKINAIVKK